jgi:tryptophan synthase beta chain
MFHPFLDDAGVRIVGAEAAGLGVTTGRHSATLSAGAVGVLHGARSYVLQDEHGQIVDTHSISAGLDYPGVGPEHSHLKDSGRVTYVGVTDDEAMAGFQILCQTEGIIPALESAHAIWQGAEIARGLKSDHVVVVCLSGRGDKDMPTVAKALGVGLS